MALPPQNGTDGLQLRWVVVMRCCSVQQSGPCARAAASRHSPRPLPLPLAPLPAASFALTRTVAPPARANRTQSSARLAPTDSAAGSPASSRHCGRCEGMV